MYGFLYWHKKKFLPMYRFLYFHSKNTIQFYVSLPNTFCAFTLKYEFSPREIYKEKHIESKKRMM